MPVPPDPLLGGEGFKLIHAGLEEMDLEIQPLVLIPSLFLGVPEDEGFVFRHGADVEFERLFRSSGGGRREAHQSQRKEDRQGSQGLHVKLLRERVAWGKTPPGRYHQRISSGDLFADADEVVGYGVPRAGADHDDLLLDVGGGLLVRTRMRSAT